MPYVIVNHTFHMMAYLCFFEDIHVGIFSVVSYSFTFSHTESTSNFMFASLLIETLVVG